MRGSSLPLVEHVALRLGPALLRDVAFLGGATIELLLTDSAVDEVRPTVDVDVITRGGSPVTFLVHFTERLRSRGFKEGGEGPHRWQVDGVVVDVMPIEEEILGFSNCWYADALHAAVDYTLPSGAVIRLVTAPYLLATKVEAFLGRGEGDYLMSHDLGDVIALVDGRAELVDEVRRGPATLQAYLAARIARWLADPDFVHLAIAGHLPYDSGRAPTVLRRLRAIANS